MVSLNDFSSTLNPQECQRANNGLCALPMLEVVSGKAGVTDYYPEIHITCDAFNTSLGNTVDFDSRPTLLIPISEPPLKRIIRTFFENGIQEAICEARNDRTAMESPGIKSAADLAHRIVEALYNIKTKIIPGLREQGPSTIASFSETRDWINSNIRCIAWHPNCFKLAIAGSDDVVRIFNDTMTLPALKTSSQRWITSMAWRPFTASELAVGCNNGICLWTIDSTMHFNRQMVCGTVLKYPNHTPVTSIEWNPDGSLLASASINSTDILIWDVDKVASAPLKRVGLPCSLLKWSPDGTSLFSSTVGNVFRVWATEKKWVPDRWTIGSGSIQSAQWSPCNSFLLFVNSNEPILYQLQFVEEQLFTSNFVI
ncbi:AAAS family protein [Megaselia abdita]